MVYNDMMGILMGVLLIPLMLLRIHYEEMELRKLEQYEGFSKKTQYKLMPYVI